MRYLQSAIVKQILTGVDAAVPVGPAPLPVTVLLQRERCFSTKDEPTSDGF